MPLSVESLAQILSCLGVDCSTWGTANGTKSIESLQKEIAKGECHLVIGSVGILRVLEVVGMRISTPKRPRCILIEKWQRQKGKEKKSRDRRPSGKMEGKETRESCLRRELRQELYLAPFHYTFKELETRVEDEVAHSYPGLLCRYIVHEFAVTLNDNTPAYITKDEFDIESEDGILQHFKWEVR